MALYSRKSELDSWVEIYFIQPLEAMHGIIGSYQMIEINHACMHTCI
jgi:hypothetical protein